MSDNQRAFIEMMKHAIEMSYHKYGNAKKTYPELAQAHKCIEERLDHYENGRPARGVAPHNKDYLVDVANFAMIESMFPVKGPFHQKADASTGWNADFSTAFVYEMFYDFGRDSYEKHHGVEGTNVDKIRSALRRYRDRCNQRFPVMDHTDLYHIAYLAYLEFFNPTFPDAFHDRNSAGEKLSPGLAGGISYKELMEGKNDGMSRPFDF